MRMETESVISPAIMTTTEYPTARIRIGQDPRTDRVSRADSETAHPPIDSETRMVFAQEMLGTINPPSKIAKISEAVSVTAQDLRTTAQEEARVKAKQEKKEGKGVQLLFPPSRR